MPRIEIELSCNEVSVCGETCDSGVVVTLDICPEQVLKQVGRQKIIAVIKELDRTDRTFYDPSAWLAS